MAREKGGPHYVWGICTNLDMDGNGTPCPNCKTKNRIKLSLREEFVCPECGEPLTKVKGPTNSNYKLIVIIAVIAILLCGAGFGIWKLVDRGPEIARIKLDKKDMTLVIGETQNDVLTATVVDKDDREIRDAKVVYKWISGDDKVAIVTQSGEVRAVNKGKTSITVKIEDGEKNRLRMSEKNIPCATCKVEVKEVPLGETPQEPKEVLVTSLSVASAKISIRKGETAGLGLSVEPENVTEGISIESSNPEVATVEDGIIKANKKGNATVTARTETSGKTATIEVTVTEPSSGSSGSSMKKTLGWGIYEGPANGFGGTITVTSTHTIDLKKASGETVTVNRGDKIVSVKMENGRLRQGEIHFADGTRKYLSGL